MEDKIEQNHVWRYSYLNRNRKYYLNRPFLNDIEANCKNQHAETGTSPE